jgi:prophage antirepressor-like protein
MNNLITPYLFGESTIRTVVRDNEPWFVVTDLCAALGLTNPTVVASRLHEDDLSTTYVIDRIGRQQPANVCNESGLYQLIFQSRKAEAKVFTRWVTSEVLPQIRKKGAYGALQPYQVAYLTTVRELIEMGVEPNAAARGALQMEKTEERKARPASKQTTSSGALEAQPDPFESLVESMEEGRIYSLTEIIDLLPLDHPTLVGRKLKALDTSVGMNMLRLARGGRIVKIPGRFARYMRPVESKIVPMS